MSLYLSVNVIYNFLVLSYPVECFYVKKALPGISLRYWEVQCTDDELYSQNYQQSVSGKVSWNNIRTLACYSQRNGVSLSLANCI